MIRIGAWKGISRTVCILAMSSELGTHIYLLSKTWNMTTASILDKHSQQARGPVAYRVRLWAYLVFAAKLTCR